MAEDQYPPPPPPATGLRPAAEDQAKPLTEVTVTAGLVSANVKGADGLDAVKAAALEAFRAAFDRHHSLPVRNGQYS